MPRVLVPSGWRSLDSQSPSACLEVYVSWHLQERSNQTKGQSEFHTLWKPQSQTGPRVLPPKEHLSPKAALGKRTGSGEEKHRVLGVKRSQREEPHKEREPEPLAGAELGRDKPEATEGARLGVEEGRESPPHEEALVLLLGAGDGGRASDRGVVLPPPPRSSALGLVLV